MSIESQELLRTTHLVVTKLTIPRGHHVKLHEHKKTHECYRILSGSGGISIEENGMQVEKRIKTDDFINIPPGTPHKIWNDDGQEIFPLIVLSAKNSTRADTVNLE